MASSVAFPDNSFSAASASSGNEAPKGRLNGDGAWSPSADSNVSDYLQIDLKYEFFICAVASQGKSSVDHWTTEYKLQLSLNNVDWVTYQENDANKVRMIKCKGLRTLISITGTVAYAIITTCILQLVGNVVAE